MEFSLRQRRVLFAWSPRILLFTSLLAACVLSNSVQAERSTLDKVLHSMAMVEPWTFSDSSAQTASEPIAELAGSSLEPRQTFRDLSEAVQFYLALARDPRWQPLAPGPLLYPGDVHPQLAQLRMLLFLQGDYPNHPQQSLQPQQLDELLAQALKDFQGRFGLQPDGVLGPQTRAALNWPPAERALQIAINLERQRHFNAKAPRHYVQVNVPEYRLKLMNNDAQLLSMKAIVGRQSRATPLLQSEIRTLVLNPSWSVPRGIAYRDILPQWRKDQAYLIKNNLKVLSGWEQPQEVPQATPEDPRFYRGSNYLRFWQPPGADNALGQVKFLFPNDYSVYLHDTPQTQLFEEPKRAFSSGCIRLEKPLQLARKLMELSADTRSLQPLLANGETRYLRLQSPVPLFITYWTVWLDAEQRLHFSPDVYRHDRQAMSEHTDSQL